MEFGTQEKRHEKGEKEKKTNECKTSFALAPSRGKEKERNRKK